MVFVGSLAKKNADQTTANYSTPAAVAWDAEIYDDSNPFHDNVSNSTRLTIPAAYNGRYGILTCTTSLSSVTSDSTADLWLTKGGSLAFIGFCGVTRNLRGNGQASTSGWLQIRSGPVLLATGNIFESILFSGDTSITVESESSFGIEVLPAGLTSRPKVLAKLSAALTAVNYSTPTAIPWDGVDVYDTNAIHDPASSNTKLIIPAALNGEYIVARAQVYATAVTASNNHSLAIRKNGSLTYDGFGANSGFISSSYTESWIQAGTQPIQVATGDEFEALYWNSDTSIVIDDDISSFGLRVVG